MQILSMKIQQKCNNFNLQPLQFQHKTKTSTSTVLKLVVFATELQKQISFTTPYIYEFKNNTLIHTILVSKTVFIYIAVIKK